MMIQNVRVSFVNVFKATSMTPDDPKKFSAMLILDKDDAQIKHIKKKMSEVAHDKWGDDIPKGVIKCLHDGAEKDHYDGLDDTKMYFNATNTKRPTVIDRDRSPLTEEDGKPYSGCYCNVTVEFWAQDNKYGKRINASLTGMQFVKDGEAFGGGAGAADIEDFEELETEDSFLD